MMTPEARTTLTHSTWVKIFARKVFCVTSSMKETNASSTAEITYPQK